VKILFRCDPALADHLPRPQLARGQLPDWLRQMPATWFSELHGREVRTVKHCPPFIDAMSFGFLVSLPCDVHVDGRRFNWDWSIPAPKTRNYPRAPLSFHDGSQLVQSPLWKAGRSAIKFNSFWTIELEPGWSLIATHPFNRFDLPFRSLTGLVDADRFHDGGINFPAIWEDDDFHGVVQRGTPVVQCFPVSRENLDLSFASFDAAQSASFGHTIDSVLSRPGVYRRQFRVKRGRSPALE
jgi:hypothetical protein